MTQSVINPVDKLRAVTPSDSANLPDGICSGIYVGSVGGGTAVSFVDNTGATVTLSGLAAGTVYPFRTSRIRSTGTTATGLFALYNV